MTPVDWYYARDNKQMGPVSAQELKRLATAGELRPEDLVWREGLTEWSLARNVRGLFDEPPTPAIAGGSGLKIGEAVAQPVKAAVAGAGQGRAVAGHPFDLLLDAFAARFNAQFIESTAKTFRALGAYGLLATMAVVAAFTVIMTIKTSQLELLFWGAIAIIILAAAQFVAGKMCDALNEQSRKLSDRLASASFPRCAALLSFLAGVAMLLLSIDIAIFNSYYTILPFGVAAFVVWAFLAAVALNPPALGISIDSHVSAGREAIGLLAFALNASAKTVPVAFGAGVICGFLLLGYACGAAFSGDNGLRLAVDTAAVARRCLWWSAFLPLAAYLVFLAVSLILDFLRALLGASGVPERPVEVKQEPNSET